MRRGIVVMSAVLLAVTLAAPASGHDERDVVEPPLGESLTYRDDGPAVVVCKPDSGQRIATLPAPLRLRNQALMADCQFEHIQQAANFVRDHGQPGTRILVLPGVYREEPSLHARQEPFGAPLGRDDLLGVCRDIVEERRGGTRSIGTGEGGASGWRREFFESQPAKARARARPCSVAGTAGAKALGRPSR